MEQLAAAGQPVDFSLIALFARASFTVQIVMVLLVVASFWAWSIIIQKFVTYAHAAQPGEGPYPANRGALRDAWGEGARRRWALPARLKLTGG